MDNRSESERYQEWIKHPVTQDVFRRINSFADDLMERYDRAPPSEVTRIQIIRALIREDLPRAIDKSINPPQREKRWEWLEYLKQIVGLK